MDSLRPDPRNARKHSADQIATLAKLIQRFGFTAPLIVTAEGGLVAGHGRLEAARRLGMAEVPILRAPDGWSEADVRAYMLADNQVALSAEWDDEMLREELRLLGTAGYDVSLTGFSEDELDRMLRAEADASTDSAVPDSSYKEQYGVIVICQSEKEQERIYDQLSSEGYSCRVVAT